ncbi:aspartic peptidase domain-containing protein [Lasiosphaeria miniovina]|uniref:Aspartic peptidase domain-containing protein n=1 Tax=Lasiosphaeria miniovina TaxID=1954250 RepID=A0AA40DR72_9PEZI|nr:aspartic peptidase domain-containing protein [Lasiosphaeria miniovina]KAK0710272.1 aspartic peptidase domain-containing protein [Lasiosphaeria miniovina]
MVSLASFVLRAAVGLAPFASLSTAGLLRGEVVERDEQAHRPERAAFRDAVTTHYVPMRSHVAAKPQGGARLRRRSNAPANLTNVHDIYYIIDLLVGNQTIPVSVDTGSSDTWMVQHPYQCVSYFWTPGGTQPDCGLGDGFAGNLSGGNIPDVIFGRSYTDGTFVQGFFGYENVSIGGLTAAHQRVAIVNLTYWYGDGRTSGLLGLGYPFMTSLNGASQEQPIAETSFLALGGLPPVSYDAGTWARTPIKPVSAMIDQWGIDSPEQGLYIIDAEAYVYGITNKTAGVANNTAAVGADGLSKNATQFPIIVDVGSTLTVLPKKLCEDVYNAFSPPAEYLHTTGLFYALCNATVPEFGVQIGGQTFFVAAQDLLRQTARDPSGDYCRVGVTDDDSGPWVLGVTFLNNVVAVFDVGNREMRFAARQKY